MLWPIMGGKGVPLLVFGLPGSNMFRQLFSAQRMTHMSSSFNLLEAGSGLLAPFTMLWTCDMVLPWSSVTRMHGHDLVIHERVTAEQREYVWPCQLGLGP